MTYIPSTLFRRAKRSLSSQVHFLMLSGIGYVLTGGCNDPKVGILGRLAALRQSQLI